MEARSWRVRLRTGAVGRGNEASCWCSGCGSRRLRSVAAVVMWPWRRSGGVRRPEVARRGWGDAMCELWFPDGVGRRRGGARAASGPHWLALGATAGEEEVRAKTACGVAVAAACHGGCGRHGCRRGLRCYGDWHAMELGGRPRRHSAILLLPKLCGRVELRAKALHGPRSLPLTAAPSGVVPFLFASSWSFNPVRREWSDDLRVKT